MVFNFFNISAQKSFFFLSSFNEKIFQNAKNEKEDKSDKYLSNILLYLSNNNF